MTDRQPDDPRNQVPPDVLAAAVELALREQRSKNVAKSQERREKKKARPPQPKHGKYRAVASGQYRRVSRPVARPEDRQYVPGALAHWRQVHGLSKQDAQARIGYSPNSSTWQQWEDGVVAPPYLALLKMIGATGLGYWTEHGSQAEGLQGAHRLAALNTAHKQRRLARRKARREGRRA